MIRRFPRRAILLVGCVLAVAASTGCGTGKELVCRLWPDQPECSTRVLKVNLQVDAELEDTVGLTNLVNELKRRAATDLASGQAASGSTTLRKEKR